MATNPAISGPDPERLQALLDVSEIRDVYYRYCRGIDRRQYDLVRSCYHADATDDHGDYRGDLEGFIDYVSATLPRFERTFHFLGNILVEVDGDRARGEAYVLALHRFRPSATKPARDHTVALRYVDDFERRDRSWRIARRLCVFELTRMDPLGDNPYVLAAAASVGKLDATDPVFRGWPTEDRDGS